jgi:hypothetical protein
MIGYLVTHNFIILYNAFVNQFNNAWNFYFNNWQYFAVLAAPVFAVEIATAYVLLPLENISPENIADYFGGNVFSIGILSLVGTVLSVGFLGSLYLTFNAKSSASELEPMSALFSGVKKFFPLFGAYVLSIIVVFFGLLLLILPGIYLAARLALFPAFIMLEGRGVMDSLKLSWEKTDEHGGILFGLTLLFVLLTSILSGIFSLLLDQGIVQLLILGILEYVIIIPWVYVYYSLYQSQKS